MVQRVVNVERRLRLQAEAVAAEKSEEVERLKGELTVLQVSLAMQFSDESLPRIRVSIPQVHEDLLRWCIAGKYQTACIITSHLSWATDLWSWSP